MKELTRDLVILGGGPGGYTAAFRAADLGREVTIIEQYSTLGGVCLNVGCIPSKTLLHLAEVIADASALEDIGISFSDASIDLDKIRSHKNEVVTKLTSGLDSLCKARKIDRIQGRGELASDSQLTVYGEEEEFRITFTDLIIAVGSRPVQIPGIPYDDKRVWDSTQALELSSIPKHMLIIGGGIIGLEMASIYQGLGSDIMVIEMTDELIPPADKDLKQPLAKKLKKQYAGIYTSTKVTSIEAGEQSLRVHLEGEKAPSQIDAETVLVAVGRRPNSDKIGIENTSIKLNDRSHIVTDQKQRTNAAHIFAIGDVTGDPMLAHRAAHQGRVAAEVASGEASAFTPLGIPSVAYTQPEIAWVGLTEKEAKEQNISYKKGSFPWQASGRALSSMAPEGVSKALFDTETGRLLGAGITGKNAGELISEAVLALEMGATAEDIGLTVHPHPTLSETFSVAADVAAGTATETVNKKK